MKLLLVIGLLFTAWSNEENMDINFGKNTDGADWVIINDGVMGGRSQGTYNLEMDYLHYSGNISLENNGGFSSLRSPYQDFNLSRFEYIEIRYRSELMDFAMNLENNRVYYLPKYKFPLPKTQGKWTTIKIDLNQFKEYILGRATGAYITDKIKSEIIRIGFINDEKRTGAFTFELDYIKFKED